MRLDAISVVVTSLDEASNIGRCLESVRGFGEVVLVDSFSADETVAIAREHGALVYQRPYLSAADQKNWALERVRHDWVLVMDADEVVTAELRDEIASLEPSASGFWIRRRSVYLGRAITGCGWQRDKVLRLFDRQRGRYDDVLVHEEVSVEGAVDRLEGRLEHTPYRDVEHHLRKINEYSTRGARDYVARNGRAALVKMALHPPARMVRMYLLQGGWRDGREGLVLCLLSAYSVFLKYAKAWELGTGAGGRS